MRPRILDGLLWFFVFQINKVNTSLLSSKLEFGLLVCPFLFFSSLSGFLHFGPYIRPHMIWSRSRLNFCQSFPGPLESNEGSEPSRSLSLNTFLGRFLFGSNEFSEPCPRLWQISVLVDIPIIVNALLLHQVQFGVSGPSYINVPKWNRQSFFFRHMELNSRFIVMTINEVTLNRPEVSSGFRVICWFCRARLFRFAFKSSTSGFPNSRPSVKPQVIWTWCRLNFCQSLPRPRISFKRCLV